MQSTRLAWVGGEHDFALRIGELRALQDATDAGPEELFNRLRLGNWRADDLIQVIRWGLVGGGSMTASNAGPMVTALVDLHPILQFKLTALAVLKHALLGSEDDPVGEAGGVTATAPENGASPKSTATARSSVSRRGKSTK